MLLRTPYQNQNVKLGQLHNRNLSPYFETISCNKDYLWGNAAYAVAACVCQTFDRYAWYAALTHDTYGSSVSQLPTLTNEEGRFGPLSASVSDNLEEALSDNGLFALMNNLHASSVFIRTGNTLHQDNHKQDTEQALPLASVLTLTRFMQYIDLLMRDKIGAFNDYQTLEAYLNAWIKGYLCVGEGSKQATAKQPLLDANITITAVPQSDSVYDIEIDILAGYQFFPPKSMKMTSRISEYFL